MPDLVAHHYQCAGCGYDLYQQPLGGSCPECGKRVPARRNLLKAKNPRRVNAGLRTAIRRAERARRNGLITLIVVALVIVTVVVLDWPRWMLWACAMPLLFGAGSVLAMSAQITHARERIIPMPPMPAGQQPQDAPEGA